MRSNTAARVAAVLAFPSVLGCKGQKRDSSFFRVARTRGDGPRLAEMQRRARCSSPGGRPLAALLLASLALAALSGACSSKSAPPASQGTVVSAAQGGTVKSADGLLTLTVSPGALAADTTIAITPGGAADLGFDGTVLSLATPAYRFSPDGLRFATPATVEIRVEGVSPPTEAAMAKGVAIFVASAAGGIEPAGPDPTSARARQTTYFDPTARTVTYRASMSHFSASAGVSFGMSYFLQEIPSRPAGADFRALLDVTPDRNMQLSYAGTVATYASGEVSPGQPPELPFRVAVGSGFREELVLLCGLPGPGEYGFTLDAAVTIEPGSPVRALPINNSGGMEGLYCEDIERRIGCIGAFQVADGRQFVQLEVKIRMFCAPSENAGACCLPGGSCVAKIRTECDGVFVGGAACFEAPCPRGGDGGANFLRLPPRVSVSETSQVTRSGPGFAAPPPLPRAQVRAPEDAYVSVTPAHISHLNYVAVRVQLSLPETPLGPASFTATTPINSMTATYSASNGQYESVFTHETGSFFGPTRQVTWDTPGQSSQVTTAPPAAVPSLSAPRGIDTDILAVVDSAAVVIGLRGRTSDGRFYEIEGEFIPRQLPDGGFGLRSPISSLVEEAKRAIPDAGTSTGASYFIGNPRETTVSVAVTTDVVAGWTWGDGGPPPRLRATRSIEVSGAELGIGCTAGEARCGTTAACTNLSLSLDHCGRCGNVCLSALRGAPVCQDHRCALDCETGYGDCDGNLVTGCEQPLTTETHCGACNRTPTEVCDGLDNNCNNRNDEGCPRRISIPTETIVTSPVWGNTQPPGALGGVQGDCFGIGGAVMVGICGDYTTHVRRIGMYCAVPVLVRQTSTVPYTHAITRGASVGCNPQGSNTSGATPFDFVCPGNMVVRRIFGEASGDLGKVGVECVELEVVPGTGNTWTLAEGATTTSQAYGSGMGTPFSWPPAAPGVAVRGINGTYGIQNPVWNLSAIGVTFRLDLYP